MASAAEQCGSGEFCPTCNPITCSGFLHQRLRFGRWKRRWFKLYGRGTMMIYDTDRSNIPVETVDIKSNCLDIHAGVRPGRFPSWVPVPCTFVISLRNKKLFLYANSVSEALQWVKALRQTSDSFKTGRKEAAELDRRLANLRESGAEAITATWPRTSQDTDIPLPPPLPAVLPVIETTDSLEEEEDTTTSTTTDQETEPKMTVTLPESFSRDRTSSNRKRKEALWHIVKKREVESPFTEGGEGEATLKLENEHPTTSVQMHQVRESGSHGDPRQTPLMECSDTSGGSLDCHTTHERTPASFTEVRSSGANRPKANKCSRSTCVEGCNTDHEKEAGVTRRRAIKFRPWSAQPPLELLKRESPIGASKTSLNEDSDSKLHVSSRLQSMETFASLNFSAESQSQQFRSVSCAGFINRIKDASAPERSTPSPCVSARGTPQPFAMIRLDRIPRVVRKRPTKPVSTRAVTFSEIITTFSPLEVPDDDSQVGSNAQGGSWWQDSPCVVSKHHSPARDGAMKGRKGGETWKHYRKSPSLDSEISKLLHQISLLGKRNRDCSHTAPYSLLRLNAANQFTDIIQVITAARKQALVRYSANPQSGEIYLTTIGQDGTLV